MQSIVFQHEHKTSTGFGKARVPGILIRSEGELMRQYLIAGAILVVMMAFQNCGKSTDQAFTAGELSSPYTMNKSRADQFSSLVMTDASSANFLEVDLSSGQIHGYDDRGIATGARYCLGDRDRLQLDELLKGAEVCEPVSQPQGENCVMIYQFPYASLKSAGREVALGEKHHGCQVPTDLCGDRAGQLKSLVASLLSRVDGLTCQ